MAQADRISTTRRSFLGGAVAAIPTAAVSAPAAQAVPDAELIALGKQFDLLQQEYEVVRQIFIPLWEEHDHQMKAWLSLHPEGRRPPGAAMAEYSRLYSALGLTDAESRHGHPDDVTNRLDPISHAIMAIPAVSLAGLAVKARATAFNAADLWAERLDDMEWDRLHFRKLIEAVTALAAANVDGRA